MEETLKSIGSLRADQTVKVSPEIARKIEKITFKEGEVVEEGQVLVKLGADEIRHQLSSRQSALKQAKARLANARRTYQRNKNLNRQDLISNQQFDDSRESFESAKARVNQLQSDVEEARERLQDATIRAPITGYVGSREVDTGNYVQKGETLTTLYRLDPLEARFTVAGRFMGRIHTGQTVRVHVSAYPEKSFEGKVYYVSPSVREQTRDILVKARVPNPEHLLKPGAFAHVETVVETYRKRPVIPAQALISTREGYIVFTVNEGKAHRRTVKIGLRKPAWVEIRKGLKPGQTVISEGHLSVSDGANVKITDESKTGGSREP